MLLGKPVAIRVGDVKDERTLFVVLESGLALSVLQGEPREQFEFGGRQFSEVNQGIFTFCFDWLWHDAHNIVGVRFDMAELSPGCLKSALHASPYASVQESDRVELFFSDERRFDVNLSDEQNVDKTSVVRSSDGLYGLQFDATALDDNTLIRSID